MIELAVTHGCVTGEAKMREDHETDIDHQVEDLGAASALTRDVGNHFTEMNGQPLTWA
jgi:hypothetical protein